MACGTYKDSSGNTTLTLESEGHGFLSGPYQATEDLRIARPDDVLGTGNLSTGRLENWYFSDNDRTLSTPYREFTRERSAACKVMPEPIEDAAEAACLVRRGRGRRLHAPAGNLPAAGRGRFAGPGGAADARDLQGGVTVVRRRGLHGGGQAGRLGNDGQGPARPAAFGGCAAAAGTAG
ncbi:hypothetical protein G6F68_009628 [Rhizopus microsporus]|nr:hypothetical protein G6F68_009628 [Rhizopus microsporus]